ncbi:MAG TPA: VacJ family lipoprotein [Rhodocyclaceae bacterium]|nr:VacJ family lipoprotein [Rhodocyclaceae bacterium]
MTTRFPRPSFAVTVLACLALVLGGCATRVPNPDDPLERLNRAMFSFNEGVDKAVLRPAAQVYDTVTPQPVRTGVGNFFSNLGDLWIGFNNMLQGKFGDGFSDWMRFGLNSTFGIVGLLDVATEAGLPKNDEDLGQTLAVWGVGEGAFVVLPFFGPRTLRDAAVLPVDMKGDQVWTVDHVATRNTFTALRLVHNRANLLGLDKTFDEASLDKYAFMRDFYLQQRRYKVHDGAPPIEYEDFNGDGLGPQTGNASAADRVAHAALGRLELIDAAEVDHASKPLVSR